MSHAERDQLTSSAVIDDSHCAENDEYSSFATERKFGKSKNKGFEVINTDLGEYATSRRQMVNGKFFKSSRKGLCCQGENTQIFGKRGPAAELGGYRLSFSPSAVLWFLHVRFSSLAVSHIIDIRDHSIMCCSPWL